VKAIYREKGYSMMCCWDNILRVVAGHGLQRYEDKRFKDLDRAVMPCSFPPFEEPPEEDWLFLVMDRCASNLSPLCFLQYHLGLRVTYFGDPNHDPWNEVKTQAHTSALPMSSRQP